MAPSIRLDPQARNSRQVVSAGAGIPVGELYGRGVDTVDAREGGPTSEEYRRQAVATGVARQPVALGGHRRPDGLARTGTERLQDRRDGESGEIHLRSSWAGPVTEGRRRQLRSGANGFRQGCAQSGASQGRSGDV